MKTKLATLLLLTIAALPAQAATKPSAPQPVLVQVQRIWDQAPHNAFTDLIRFKDQWFCVFREASTHGVAKDGKIRVITSKDGRTWQSAALISSPVADLRDPKLAITSDSRLMITGAGAFPQPGPYLHQSLVWFSNDGREWDGPVEVGDKDVWLWRVEWHGDTAYGVGYSTRADRRFTRFYKSKDGRKFDTVVESLATEGYANETGIIFDGDTLLCLLRRDSGTATAQLGRAEPPYTQWTWQDLGIRVGGPDMLKLPDGRIVVGGRLYDGGARTVLLWLDPVSGKLTEFLKLPSGGDTSYPGLVWHEDRLWVSYYSSHEGGKSMIYLAEVNLAGKPARADASKSGEPVKIGSRLEPLLDDYLIEDSKNLELRLHKPAPREVVIVHDAPWEGNVCAYHTVFKDGDLYRMYYRGAHYEIETRKITHELVCYAESKDGIHWSKPELGLVEFKGDKRNNVIWGGIGVHNFAPFRDLNPNAAPEEKYKALASGRGGLYAFRSPDAIRWSLMSDKPVITKGAFDSQNLAFWDVTRKRYVDFHRGFREGVRDIMTATSLDFLKWTEPVWLEYPESPDEHLYTNQILPYHRAPHIFLGFPMRFLPQRKAATHPLPGISDGVFMSSRDGRSFKRWGEAIIRPGLQADRWVNRNNMTAWGLVETASDIPGTPPELSLYSTEGYYAGDAVRLRRFTWRLDGFASMQAPLSGGEFTTKPILFEGEPRKASGNVELVLNYATSAAGSVQCELLDAAGKPLPGFTLADSSAMYGDTIEQTVSWKGQSDLKPLVGQPVRLRFVLKDADLFAFRFR